jgi:hypothetical protein
MKNNLYFKIVFLGILLSYTFKSQAVIRYVKPVASGLANASSWADASGNLTAIMAVAQPGDEIWVATGIYKPTTGTDRNFSFILKNGVNMYGGFNGTESTLALRDIAANPTILSGDINPNNDEDSYHVVVGNLVANGTTIFDGFTITGGRANGNPGSNLEYYSFGGGMYFIGLSPIIRNCIFTQNEAQFGGAITFKNNENTPYQFAISPKIENCRFYNNSALFFGGAFLVDRTPNITFTHCQFFNNTAFQGGAGYSNLLDGNIYNDCLFYNNTAEEASCVYGASTIETYNNCVFWGNTATVGGGVFTLDYTSFTFNHCSFAQNTSPTNSTIYIRERYSLLKATNSIIWSVDANAISIPSQINTLPIISHSIIKGGYAGCINCPGGNGNVDPLFNNEADLDGANDVLVTADDGLRLTGRSPALNAGTFTTVVTDILGQERYPNSAAFVKADLGAYENGICNTALTRLYVNDDAQGDNTGSSWANALTNLRIAINIANTCPNVTEVWVAKGIYKPTDTQDRSFSFNMKNNLAIYGGFASNETLLSQRIWQKNPTILSGDINPANEEDTYNVIYNFELNGTAVLDGFTITGGRATDTNDKNGAGMNNSDADVIIRNCVFKNNSAIGNGGGMYNKTSIVNISNSVFAENNSDFGGGGLFNALSSDITCYNSVFTNNTSVGYGGGITNNGSNPIYINCTIVGNNATLAGDGMQNTGSNPALINCVLFGNGTASETNKEINNLLGAVPALSYSVVEGGYAGCVNCPPNVTNPLFLDTINPTGPDGIYATEDDGLALSAVSPLSNQGLNSANSTAFDVVGRARIQENLINIGAYETSWIMSNNSGFWGDPASWNVGRLPTVSDYVFIKDNHELIVNVPVGRAHFIIISTNAKITIPAPTFLGSYKLELN